jgi:hypothetical protein
LKVFHKSIVLLSTLISFHAFAQSVSFKKYPNFVFGLATAPAHSEDDLNDAWLTFARAGGIAAWRNIHKPEERLRFWSEPEVELGWTASTGVRSIRIGLDWGRLVPHLPGSTKIFSSRCVRMGLSLQSHSSITRFRNGPSI